MLIAFFDMFSVKVVDSSTGRAVKGARVSVGFDGFFRGFSNEEYTDSDGEVNFDNENGEGTIYVNGQSKYRGYISGRKVIYI